MMEPSVRTLEREMEEELDTAIHVERLIWVVENFFEYDEKSHHELGLYFLMKFPRDSRLYSENGPFEGWEEGTRVVFAWHPLDRLSRITLYPSFLREALRSIPNQPEHVVHKDSDDMVRG